MTLSVLRMARLTQGDITWAEFEARVRAGRLLIR